VTSSRVTEVLKRVTAESFGCHTTAYISTGGRAHFLYISSLLCNRCDRLGQVLYRADRLVHKPACMRHLCSSPRKKQPKPHRHSSLLPCRVESCVRPVVPAARVVAADKGRRHPPALPRRAATSSPPVTPVAVETTAAAPSTCTSAQQRPTRPRMPKRHPPPAARRPPPPADHQPPHCTYPALAPSAQRLPDTTGSRDCHCRGGVSRWQLPSTILGVSSVATAVDRDDGGGRRGGAEADGVREVAPANLEEGGRAPDSARPGLSRWLVTKAPTTSRRQRRGRPTRTTR